MTERNGANWCFWKDTEAEKVGEGVERRVLAFCDELMCVENTFEKGGIGVMHHHPLPRSHTWPADVSALPSAMR